MKKARETRKKRAPRANDVTIIGADTVLTRAWTGTVNMIIRGIIYVKKLSRGLLKNVTG